MATITKDGVTRVMVATARDTTAIGISSITNNNSRHHSNNNNSNSIGDLAMGMAIKDMDQGNSMVPHQPVRTILPIAAGVSRVAGVDLDSSSGVAIIVSNHGVDLDTVPAVARGGRLCHYL
ncbi:uncharacterized protein LOC135102738 [Scylla paramamosain]|uniref:uncharacterized protein LOC135102738 n=1 Tax=Scylla paramamosain TaxID=85552 RepID=UPI0030837D82